MSLTNAIQNLSIVHFWLFSGLSSATAVIGFYLAFSNLRKARLIEDIPTAKIRSATQGFIELEGIAGLVDNTPIVSPLTGEKCCWYHYKIERKNDKNFSTIKEETSKDPFVLQDDTGECLIHPTGAEVKLAQLNRNIWYSSREYWSGLPPKKGLKRTKITDFGQISLSLGRYRYTSELIYPGNTLYATGHFKSLDDIDHHRNRSALHKEILGDLKADQKTLLKLFDRNKDGQIDEQEWNKTRQVAEKMAKKRYQIQLSGTHLHSLSKPKNLPLLLSTLPQADLIKRYRHRSILGFSGFFALGAVAVLLFNMRFGT